ncbi:MAG: M48 family metalloprotease [Nanoarchaeota archaeon]
MIQHPYEFLTNTSMWIIIFTSLTLAFYSFYEWKAKRNYLFVYAHLVFLLIPLVLFANGVNCSMSIINGLLALCGLAISKFLIYVSPLIIFSTFAAGYFIVPLIYVKRFAKKEIKNKTVSQFNKIYATKVKMFVIDDSHPIAFTIAKNIFVSVGMFEILSSKETEAVILHELGHIKHKTSLNRLSAGIMRFASPLSYFGLSDYCKDCDEKEADEFAISVQKTKQHLSKARKKVRKY